MSDQEMQEALNSVIRWFLIVSIIGIFTTIFEEPGAMVTRNGNYPENRDMEKNPHVADALTIDDMTRRELSIMRKEALRNLDVAEQLLR